MDVSVIIVSWNTRELLCDCIKSVYEQAGNIEFEVIVVDNASQDDSCEMVRQFFPKAVLIVNSTNMGYACAVNKGIKTARGRYVLVLNSDILIRDSVIEKTVRYADEHPGSAVIGCRVEEDDDKIHPTCRQFPSLLNLLFEVTGLNRMFPMSRFFGREYMMWWPRDSELEVDVVSGMFMLVRKEAIEEVGMMDESFFFLFEETDWCYRFAKAGWKMLFWPGAKIIHRHGGGQSRKKAGAKINVQFQRGMLIFFRKHYGRIRCFIARILLILHSIFCLLAWGILRLYRGLVGRDNEYEKSKMLLYSGVLTFCLLGIEPGRGGLKQVVGKTVRAGIEIICAVLYRVYTAILRKPPVKVVLYYHAVRQGEVAGFENQMKYLAKSCRVVRLSEIMKVSKNGSKLAVAIVFDDAFKSVRDNALPVLERYGLTAAMAVPTGVMGRALDWWVENDCDDKGDVVLGKEDIAGIDRRGYEIVSHTVSHRNLTQIGMAELKTELCESKRMLEQILGHEVDGIVYPYGACNKTVCEAAAEAGYRIGFSIEPKTICQSVNPLCIGRFKVAPNESMVRFKLKVKGAYRAVAFLRKLKHILMGR
jgi:GT2 family glycosyltransferase/peptidoglycan/xylan/chitin deacetylase (PgdA/CDA1 family)